MIDEQGSDWETAAEDAELHDRLENSRAVKKAFPLPKRDMRDGKEAFGMVPISIITHGGINDGVKTLFAYADKLQGDNGWSATGYRRTAEALNWPPMKVLRHAEEGRDIGLFALPQRVPPNGDGQPQIVIEVIHNPARGRINPNYSPPPEPEWKSLKKSPPMHKKKSPVSGERAPLYQLSETPVSNDDQTCIAGDTESRSLRSRSIEGEASFSSASQPLKASKAPERAHAISDEEFSESFADIADKLSDLADVPTREQLLEIRRVADVLDLDNEMVVDRIAIDLATYAERLEDLTATQADQLIASLRADQTPPTPAEPEPIAIPRTPTIGAYQRKLELVGASV